MKFGPPPEEAMHLQPLGQNAAKYFEEKFGKSASFHGTRWATHPDGEVIYFLTKTYFDMDVGVQYRVIIIDDLGKNENQLHAIALYRFDDGSSIGLRIGDGIPSEKMPMSPRIYLYTNKRIGSIGLIKQIFTMHQPDTFIEIIEEHRMHKTLFISYGAPDEEIATKINNSIKSKGVETWFFPEDSIPGQKLHRMMSEAVHKYDRTLLICSKNSVVRGGVLNEIERLLEREANEGGTEIIIPVSLDDYIFNDWKPEKSDIKRQVLSRVVCKINNENFDTEIGKILNALKK